MSEEMAQAQEATSEGSTTEATTVDESTGEQTETAYAGGKFKTVSDLENSYIELQKSYSQKLGKFDGAPEEYTLAEGYENNSLTEALTSWGKENQLNNDGLNNMLEVMNQVQENDAKAYRESQLAELGKDADARIKNASDWALANLGEEAVAGINSMWVGAKGIEAIEKIMKLAQGTAPASVPAKPSFDAEQVRAMRFAEDEYGNRKMSTDPVYRKKVLEAEAALSGSSSGYIV
jgi:hypothetical protein